VHLVEQLRAGVRGAAEPVARLAVSEMRVHLARVHGAALAHEGEQGFSLRPARLRPRSHAFARVHEIAGGARQEAVVDEEILLDRQRRVAALEVAGAVARARGGAA
jgi:hypothetical protein